MMTVLPIRTGGPRDGDHDDADAEGRASRAEVVRGRRRGPGARPARHPGRDHPAGQAQARLRAAPRRGRPRGGDQRREGAPHRAEADRQDLPLAQRLHRGPARGERRADAQDPSRARDRVGGAGHAPEGPPGPRDGQEAEGLPRGGASPRRPEARAARLQRRVGAEEPYGRRAPFLRHRAAQDLGGARLAPGRHRPHPDQSPPLRGLLPARDAAHDHLPAAPAHQHARAVRRHRQRGRRRPHRPGGGGPPRDRARAPRVRRQAAADAQAGRAASPAIRG